MIVLLLFVTCLVAVTNLMLVIMKEQRGAGAGGHREIGFRGFLWGFFFFCSPCFLNGCVFFCTFFFSPGKISMCLAVGCVFLFF